MSSKYKMAETHSNAQVKQRNYLVTSSYGDFLLVFEEDAIRLVEVLQSLEGLQLSTKDLVTALSKIRGD